MKSTCLMQSVCLIAVFNDVAAWEMFDKCGSNSAVSVLYTSFHSHQGHFDLVNPRCTNNNGWHNASSSNYRTCLNNYLEVVVKFFQLFPYWNNWHILQSRAFTEITVSYDWYFNGCGKCINNIVCFTKLINDGCDILVAIYELHYNILSNLFRWWEDKRHGVCGGKINVMVCMVGR